MVRNLQLHSAEYKEVCFHLCDHRDLLSRTQNGNKILIEIINEKTSTDESLILITLNFEILT